MEKPLILAVDDEEDFLEIASMLLGSSGFEMATLATPTEASLIRRCVELQPALVLLDVYLAGEPVGISLARALKSNSKTADIKVILWSAAPLPANFAADDFFNKSDDLAVLVDKIKLHLPAQFYSEA